MKSPLWILASLLMGCATTASNAQVEVASILNERWQSARVANPANLTDEEIARVELLFARSLDRAMTSQTLEDWADLGFRAESISLRGDPCRLLVEAPDMRLGRGMFLLCPTRSQSSTLLVPHGFHDRFTAEIATLFAIEGRFRAVAWNTTPRDVAADDDSDEPKHDVAHAEESYFTSLARATSVLGLRGPIVELHGFAPYLRSTEAGRSARAILSSGTTIPHASTLVASDCLKAELGDRWLVFPTEVNELGGTLNRVAAVLRDWGRRDFLHLELSFALRKRLLEDPRTRASVVACIEGASR